MLKKSSLYALRALPPPSSPLGGQKKIINSRGGGGGGSVAPLTDDRKQTLRSANFWQFVPKYININVKMSWTWVPKISTCNWIPLVQTKFNPTRIEKLTTPSGILSGPGRGQSKNCFGRSWLDFQYNIVSERILTLRVIDFEGLVYKGMIYWLVDLAGQAGKVGFCGVVATINCVVTQEIWRITRTLLYSAPALLLHFL